MQQSTHAPRTCNHLRHFVRRLASRIVRLPTHTGLWLLKFYRSTLSPDHGPMRYLYPYGYCRHHPTCSEFGMQQIARYGLTVGTFRLAWRVLHCTPFTRPDPAAMLRASGMGTQQPTPPSDTAQSRRSE